ncbi:probable glutamate--tRNA ligase, mitochondrial isoform X1 [Vespa crabro]|uniref:probable glutamate--tRNA ligase, mitochondrial isoform X1 n=2 Tax=Vespa crabro TaxID=7445 RepID=UPI001F0227B2|nr:probable glutamate--tRNA ligase, mitochondrial isoform X1 [Vespa crabro]
MRGGTLRIVNFLFLQKRFCSQQVRVRFAPSPTGYLHLGGLRTALYNYLFARANNGTFILRIEDTDKSRTIPGAIEKLHDDLIWVGIISDEDPMRGGPYGPYLQSKRLEIYKENIKTLLENKTAYYCFCSESRMNLLKREAIKNGHVPKYDNKCRHSTDDEINEKLKNGIPYCIRFKLSSDIEEFDDLIYGRVAHDITQVEGDPVIMKSDGFPTYHFANVVDDHYMNISHVLRGVEWQISTPKHIMLYKAFGWKPPIYGHLPLILNSDGSKLSKRQDGIRIDSFRNSNIFPLALLNYVTQAGGGFIRNSDVQIYTYEHLIKQFDIKRINGNSSKLAPEKLLELNKLEISRLLSNQNNYKFLVERVKKIVEETFSNCEDKILKLDEDHIIQTLKWAQNRINKLSDLVKPDFAFIWVIPTSLPDIISSKFIDAIKNLDEKLTETDENSLSTDISKLYLKELAEKNDISFPSLMKTLRKVLSGLEKGPGVIEMIEILGKNETQLRLKRCLS